MKSERILLTRLAEYGIAALEWDDPWGAGFHPDMLNEGKDLVTQPFDPCSMVWSSEKHAARVRFIAQTPKLMGSPIAVDCMCNAGSILAIPVIVDGWHRLHAHWFLRRKSITAIFDGRLDLWNYLRGVSSVVPD